MFIACYFIHNVLNKRIPREGTRTFPGASSIIFFASLNKRIPREGMRTKIVTTKAESNSLNKRIPREGTRTLPVGIIAK